MRDGASSFPGSPHRGSILDVEIVHRSKVYAFDTGFVTHAKGWDSIREDDRGVLWEHLVLDAIRAGGAEAEVRYWRDKTGRELDFVLHRGGKRVDVVECKIRADRFDPEVLAHFRSLYPSGRNFVVTPYDDSGFVRRLRGHDVHFVGITHLLAPTYGRGRPGAGARFF